MDKLAINMLDDSKYVACITVLDYEISLSRYLKQLTFKPSLKDSRCVLVDLALKSGMNLDRFVEFNVDKLGKIELNTCKYILPDSFFENLANNILREKKK